MSSRKRWQTTYTAENPFALTQAVARGVRTCCKQAESTPLQTVKYLWIHLPGGEPAECSSAMGEEEWMSVIDEGASQGATSIIVSVGSPLHAITHFEAICNWAQQTYGMVIGIHAYVALDPKDSEVLGKLDQKLTRVFSDGEHMESARFVEALGLPLYSADGLKDDAQPRCDLPSDMACVGHDGTMYTCGLVMGQEEYSLGHVMERKLSSVIEDEALPHTIPAGASDGKHRCNGCPPLMAKRIEQNPA